MFFFLLTLIFAVPAAEGLSVLSGPDTTTSRTKVLHAETNLEADLEENDDRIEPEEMIVEPDAVVAEVGSRAGSF